MTPAVGVRFNCIFRIKIRAVRSMYTVLDTAREAEFHESLQNEIPNILIHFYKYFINSFLYFCDRLECHKMHRNGKPLIF